jgi:hypothetical protein
MESSQKTSLLQLRVASKALSHHTEIVNQKRFKITTQINQLLSTFAGK